MEMDCQHSAGTGIGCKGAREEGLGFTLINLASTNVLAHNWILAGPVKFTTYHKFSLFPLTMSICWGIVTLIHDAQAQVVMSGKDDARRVAGNGCIVQQPVSCCVP